jgi:aspartate-semialdehyde dehydrogenase
MVGSVLLQRMLAERDFDHVDPVFFSTSRAGGTGPDVGRKLEPLRDANDPAAFAGLDAVITCQGGDWTNAMHPKLRASGWNGHGSTRASAPHGGRRGHRPSTGQPPRSTRRFGAHATGWRNCTVSLMMMASPACSSATCRVDDLQCTTRPRRARARVEHALSWSRWAGTLRRVALDARPVPDIDREVAGILRDDACFLWRRSWQPDPVDHKFLGNGMSRGEGSGRRRLQDPGRGNGSGKAPIPVSRSRVPSARCAIFIDPR